MLGSLEKHEDVCESTKEEIFEPAIVCFHSECVDGDERCSQCYKSEPLQSIPCHDNHNHLHHNLHSDSTAHYHTLDTHSATDDEVLEIEKENDGEEDAGTESNDLSHDDLNSKLRFIFHLDGLREAGGLLYIGCDCDTEKTNPSKILECFSTDFLNIHRVYAIREEEPFLLKVFTRNHEIVNRGIRKKGGRKVMLMGKEVFGDVLLACGRCGYWSCEGSNVRRHLKKAVCLKEKGYCKEQLAGMDTVERRRFLRRVAAAKCRAKKKARALSEGCEMRDDVENTTPSGTTSIITTATTAMTVTTTTTAPTTTLTDTTTTTTTKAYTATTHTAPSYPSCPVVSSEEPYVECLVEIQENFWPGNDGKAATVPASSHLLPLPSKRKIVRRKALTLGPAVTPQAVLREAYDIFTISDSNERVAWRPPHCHKVSPGVRPCQIVFKGARMKRRCLDLPLPKVLIYRKLDCKTHHCNFTLFHPCVRTAFHTDSQAKATIETKLYGDTMMTEEFYHYFVSLVSIMKMKSSQIARHLTNVWETILAQRLGTAVIPEEHRKIITLSKQTVKSIWTSIEEEAESKGDRLFKRSRRRKKLLSSVVSSSVPVPPPPSTLPPLSSVDGSGMIQASSLNTEMKQHIPNITTKLRPILPAPPPPPPPPPTHPPHPPPPTHPPLPTHAPPGPLKSTMMPLPPPPPPPPHPSLHTSMQQSAPHGVVNHTNWFSQTPQYPHNMTPYHMPPHPPSSEYYPMPSHFMTQYTPPTIGTSL